MLEMWLSNERLVSNSTLRFLTNDEDSTEQPSSVRLYFMLLHQEDFGPIIIKVFFTINK